MIQCRMPLDTCFPACEHMKKISNTEMIDHLSRFRAAGDKVSESVFELSTILLKLSTDLESKEIRTEEEQAIFDVLKENINLVLSSVMSANEYNNSMWVDYTPVIKQLGDERGE